MHNHWIAPRPLSVRNAAVACFLSSGIATAAHAAYSFSTAPTPGGFIQACAGPSTNGANWPGFDFFPYFGSPSSDLHETAFSGDVAASSSATYSVGTIANSASGTVGLGYAQLVAQNSAPTSASFPAGIANGGWSETFTISNRAYTGQTGYLQFTLHVSGTLFASGPAGAATFEVTGYKDASQLMANSLFSPGNSDPLSTDRQYGHWAIATFGNPPSASKAVDDTVTFAVPFTFGTPFKLAIYADAIAGMRAQGGLGNISTADANFSDGLTWGGIVNVYHGLTPTSEYTIVSGSGIDWSGPGGPPNPADLNGDGAVNAADLAILLGAWGTPAGDVNGDGTTDAMDLSILLGAWT
ncbi:MAG: dockerin type I repeat-containing protein [Phycisphaerales bacterium]